MYMRRRIITSRNGHTSPTGRPEDRTHAPIDGVVVFHIGMTIRKPHRPDLWMPVFRAMPQMLVELHRNRAAADRGEAEDLGFLDAQTLIGRSGPFVVQYWRSTDHLYTYARSPEHLHVPAWKRFNRAAREHPEAVGVWHETFAVPADGIETLYGNGAMIGLGRAVGSVPRSRRGVTAQERLAAGRRALTEEASGPEAAAGDAPALRAEDLEPR